MLKADNFAYDYSKAFPPASHPAKLNYRIVPPLIAKMLGIHMLRKAEFLAYLLLCSCLFYFLYNRESWQVAFLTTLAMVCTSSGACYFNDWGHVCDVFAHALIAVSLLSFHPAVVIVVTALAVLTDERAVLLLPVAMGVAAMLRGRQQSLYYAYGLALYGAIRLILYFAYYNHPTDYRQIGSWDIILANLRMLPTVVWSSLEGGWILVIGTAVLIFRLSKMTAILLVSWAVLGASLSACVLDMTRSASYQIFLPVLCIVLLQHHSIKHRTILSLSASAAVVSIICPNSLFIAGYIDEWQWPFSGVAKALSLILP